jgi:hypothetical protein
MPILVLWLIRSRRQDISSVSCRKPGQPNSGHSRQNCLSAPKFHELGCLTYYSWYDFTVRLQAHSIVVQSDITIESCKIQGTHYSNAHYLRSVQDEADVIERWGDKTTRRNKSATILVLESICKGESCKESANTWYQQLQLGLVSKPSILMVNYIKSDYELSSGIRREKSPPKVYRGDPYCDHQSSPLRLSLSPHTDDVLPLPCAPRLHLEIRKRQLAPSGEQRAQPEGP